MGGALAVDEGRDGAVATGAEVVGKWGMRSAKWGVGNRGGWRRRRKRKIIAGLEGELVEEGVVAFVGGPDGEVVGPGDAALSGLPKEFSVGMFGEFIEADVAAVNGHGLRMGGEGNDAGAVVEFDVADFDFFGEGGPSRYPSPRLTGRGKLQVIFAVRDDGAGDVEEFDEVAGEAHVFEGTGIIFSGEEVVAGREMQALANVFEGVGVGPTDADGFFGEGEHLLLLLVKSVFGENPGDLMRHEALREDGGAVELDEWEDGAHWAVDGWMLMVDG